MEGSFYDANWMPSASLTVLIQRAEIVANIRRFFTDRHYLEVETPVMGQFGVTDVYLSNIKAEFRGAPYNLQTSPEYHMKRLLAAGSGPIYQLARVFRDDELGRWHNPEFTLLEWYKLEVDHHALINEVEEFLKLILKCNPLVRKTYQQVFLEICSLDPLNATIEEFKWCIHQHALDNVLPEDETDRDQYLFLLMSHVIEPALAPSEAPVVVYDFPISQASLAKVKNGVAERFEIYYKGVELANGFHELTEGEPQRQRFAHDNLSRASKGIPQCAPDEYLLSALSSGLPSCSGVALGVDRLVALALEQQGISPVMAFDFARA